MSDPMQRQSATDTQDSLDGRDERCAAGPRSHLYRKPVAFQGCSLEGAPRCDDPGELARSLDVDMPVEDLHPIKPCPDVTDRISIVMSPSAVDVDDDDDDALIERRATYARSVSRRLLGRRDPVRGGAGSHGDSQVARPDNTRWAALASASRFVPVSFGDSPCSRPALAEHRTTSFSGRGDAIADSHRGVELPNTLDRSHAAHFIPEARIRGPGCETGSGRIARAWHERPFSCRERVLNALSMGESLSPDWIDAPGSSEDGSRTACGPLPSSQYRAMVGTISDSGGESRHDRWRMYGPGGARLLQLIEMLDQAAVVV